MAVKNSRNALWALVAAGGVWAWQNRDKIKGFIEQQRSSMQGQTSTTPAAPTRYGTPGYQGPETTPATNFGPATGETTRMSEDMASKFTDNK